MNESSKAVKRVEYAYEIKFNNYGVVYAFAEDFAAAEKLARQMEEEIHALNAENSPKYKKKPFDFKSIVKLPQTNPALISTRSTTSATKPQNETGAPLSNQ